MPHILENKRNEISDQMALNQLEMLEIGRFLKSFLN